MERNPTDGGLQCVRLPPLTFCLLLYSHFIGPSPLPYESQPILPVNCEHYHYQYSSEQNKKMTFCGLSKTTVQRPSNTKCNIPLSESFRIRFATKAAERHQWSNVPDWPSIWLDESTALVGAAVISLTHIWEVLRLNPVGTLAILTEDFCGFPWLI